MSKLYDIFTYKGNLVQRWKNYGIDVDWDEATQTLNFKYPEVNIRARCDLFLDRFLIFVVHAQGWTSTMSEETRAETLRDWCIDEPTLDVKYQVKLDGQTYPVIVRERDNDRLEFTSNVIPLKTVGDATVAFEFTAQVKGKKKLVIFSGEFDPKGTLRQLGDDDNAGLLFNLGHGFALFVHFADQMTISSVALLGKLDDVLH